MLKDSHKQTPRIYVGSFVLQPAPSNSLFIFKSTTQQINTFTNPTYNIYLCTYIITLFGPGLDRDILTFTFTFAEKLQQLMLTASLSVNAISIK